MLFQDNFKGVSRKLQWCFRNVKGDLECFKVYQGILREDSRCQKEVSCCLALIAATRAEGGLVFYGFQYLLNIEFCSAWPRLKLNTKIGLHTTTHHPPPPPPHKLLGSNISAVTARFGSNFKQRVLGTYTPDYNCYLDICRGNICPGDICPYQQYLSCYQPYLDQIINKGSREHIQQITTVATIFVLGTFVHIRNISAVTGPIWIKF